MSTTHPPDLQPSSRSGRSGRSGRTGRSGRGPRGGPPRRGRFGGIAGYVVAILVTAAVTFLVVGLLTNIFERQQEARAPYQRVVEVTEDTIDPAIWGQNWPLQYDSYRRTVDYERTRYGGSDAIPMQKLDKYPWLRKMWSGYAFALDYREARGHAYMLFDQDHTERVLQRPQPGACLHCHSSVMKAYRVMGDGDVMAGFRKVNAMPWSEARRLQDAQGNPLIEHPAACVDCHHPETMQVRATRPAFLVGIAAYQRSLGREDYDVNRDASRQEMRSYVCAQCHVEYYFKGEGKEVTFPWSKGLKVEEIEAYYDEEEYSDWRHGITGAGVLKAQHPEFEVWSQGTHARAGVSCSDCHMPYVRTGASKVSDHHVRSPLLNIAHACQTCHRVSEDELRARAHVIQDRTLALIDRAAVALDEMLDTLAATKQAGISERALEPAYALQRRAQWRLDFAFSENSHGFHAGQEIARILAESIDYSRQARQVALSARATPAPEPPPAPPVIGVTPREEAPPGPLNPPPKRN